MSRRDDDARAWDRKANISHYKRICPGCGQPMYRIREHDRCIERHIADQDASGTNPSFRRKTS
jgi:hypothetical protein